VSRFDATWASSAIDVLPVPVLGVDGEGNVHWANRVATTMLGFHSTTDRGTSIARWLHPDDIEVALLAAMVSDAYPELVGPVRYRVVGADGVTYGLEVLGRTDAPPVSPADALSGAELNMVVAFPIAHRETIEEAVASMGAGEPFDRSIALLHLALRSMFGHTDIAFVVHTATGPLSFGDPLPAELLDWADPTGPALLEHLDAAPSDVASAARDHGYAAAAAVFVDDPAGFAPSAIVAWTIDPLLALRFRVRAQREPATVFSLALRQRAAVEALAAAARTDALTGLANRTALFEHLRRIRSGAWGGTRCTICYLDLDGFKPINDTLGHDAGDHVLTAVAERLRQCVRADDVVARVGGDEFVVLCRDVTELGETTLADRMVEAVGAPVSVPTHASPAVVGVSIGTCTLPAEPDEADIDDALRRADAAMYRAKADGGGRVVRAETAPPTT